MDISFSRFEIGRRAIAPAPLDYPGLVATLAAHQATSQTAGIAALLALQPAAGISTVDALNVVFAARSGWTGAVAELGGCFSPAVVAPVESSRKAL